MLSTVASGWEAALELSHFGYSATMPEGRLPRAVSCKLQGKCIWMTMFPESERTLFGHPIIAYFDKASRLS